MKRYRIRDMSGVLLGDFSTRKDRDYALEHYVESGMAEETEVEDVSDENPPFPAE